MKTARTPKEPKPLENVIQKHCLMRFKKLGVQAHRRNIAGMTAEYKGKTRFIRAGEKHQSDAWFILPLGCERQGVHGECEIKRPGNKPNLGQTMWLRDTNEITGASFWCDSPDVLERVVKALMAGGRIVYHEGQCSYPNPIKGGKGKVFGPTYEYDVEVPDYDDD